MIVAFQRSFSRSALTNSSNSADSLVARTALIKVIDRLQVLVLENPTAALVAIGLLEGLLDE